MLGARSKIVPHSMSHPIVFNYPAILVAALAGFILGGVWYSPVMFGNAWMRANALTAEMLKARGHPAMIFGGAFFLTLIMAFNLAAFLSGPPNLVWGATAGCLVGAGWVGLSLGVIYLFERKSAALFFINAGYMGVAFTMMGAIIGAWK